MIPIPYGYVYDNPNPVGLVECLVSSTYYRRTCPVPMAGKSDLAGHVTLYLQDGFQ